MTTYVVDATNPAEPNDDRPASYLGIEMRTLKQHVVDVLAAQDLTNTAKQNAIDAINTILNSANGKTGLPVAGLLEVVLSIHKEVFGYTEGQTIYPSIASKITTLANNVNNVLTANYQNLLSITQQQTLDINSLKQQVQTLQSSISSVSANAGRIPVGGIYITSIAANPNTYLGYGTWVQRCLGRGLSGVGNGTASGGFNYSKGQAGNKDWYLSYNQMPEHQHYSGVLVRTQNDIRIDTQELGVGSWETITWSNLYKGSFTATWETHKDYGTSQQKMPMTTRAGHSGRITYNIPVETYYIWERTA